MTTGFLYCNFLIPNIIWFYLFHIYINYELVSTVLLVALNVCMDNFVININLIMYLVTTRKGCSSSCFSFLHVIYYFFSIKFSFDSLNCHICVY